MVYSYDSLELSYTDQSPLALWPLVVGFSHLELEIKVAVEEREKDVDEE